MREIKFRAWEKSTNSMVYDVQNVSKKRIIGESACESFQEVVDSWEYETMQYTGLKDKNVKEIYEGDIIEFNNNDYARTAGHLDDEIIIAKVEYHCGHYGLKEANGQLHDLYVSLVNDEEAEIIGNVYEDENLLK